MEWALHLLLGCRRKSLGLLWAVAADRFAHVTADMTAGKSAVGRPARMIEAAAAAGRVEVAAMLVVGAASAQEAQKER